MTSRNNSGMHTIFSIEDWPYQHWQALLLDYSHSRARQPGPLTCLVSSLARPHRPRANWFYTPSWSHHPITHDYYRAYNKPAAITDWIRRAPPKEDVVLILDPDCVFLSPLAIHVTRWHPVGQRIYTMAPIEHLLRKHCAWPERIQHVGVPLLLHRDDLAIVAPRWLAKTEALRNDLRLRSRLGWVAEMWGYCLAAAELGLTHRLLDIQSSLDDEDDRAVVHYWYEIKASDGRWSWGKRSYRPWERVSDPPPGTPSATVALIRILNEAVEAFTHEEAALPTAIR